VVASQDRLDKFRLVDCGLEDGCTLNIIKRRVVLLLTASNDGTAKIWSISTGECVQTLDGHDRAVVSAVFSTDGASVLTASLDRTAKIWSTSTRECVQTLDGHHGGVLSAVFSTDGASVLTASGDRTAKIWSTSTGECVQTLDGHGDEVNSAVFQPTEMLTRWAV
jgi:WD40 repeat protein